MKDTHQAEWDDTSLPEQVWLVEQRLQGSSELGRIE